MDQGERDSAGKEVVFLNRLLIDTVFLNDIFEISNMIIYVEDRL